MKIGELFDFNSEIACTINLISIEEILMKELKSNMNDQPTSNKLRWNEFKELSYEAFFNDKKFEPEKQYIQKLIRKNLQSRSERAQKSFYLYHKHNKSKTVITEDDDRLTRVDSYEEKANLIIIPQNYLIQIRQDSNKIMISNLSKLNTTSNQEKKRRKYSTRDPSKDFKDENKNKARSHRSFLEEKSNYLNIEESCDTSDSENENEVIDSFLEETKQDKRNTVKIKKNISCGNVLISHESPKIETEIPLDIHEIKELHDEFVSRTSKVESHDDNLTPLNYSMTKIENARHRKNNSDKLKGFFSIYRDTSQYSNLVNIFRYYFKGYKFVEIIENYSTLKIAKNTLEKVSIPQFRDIKIQSELIENEIINQTGTKTNFEEPLSVNNKKILLFIGILVLLFVCAISFIFIFL